jgi:hypothetical protein
MIVQPRWKMAPGTVRPQGRSSRRPSLGRLLDEAFAGLAYLHGSRKLVPGLLVPRKAPANYCYVGNVRLGGKVLQS